jgi:uncharacterized protein YndB with AHSA1/START domain
MTSVVHDSFAIERTYPATPERVFAAWSDPGAKAQWFGGDSDIETVKRYALDFRMGGSEHLSGVAGGFDFEFDSTYYDIVPDTRIVWSYDMHLNGRRISVSVGTVELTAVPGGTKLVMTEQGAFLDGLDTNAQREEGTRQVLENLAAWLARD